MKWLVVGAGSIGLKHLETLKAASQEVAIAEPDAGRRHEASEYTHGMEFADLTNALAVAQPEVALVCTPTYLHVDHAIQCANAGCHVIIEKPVSHTMERKDELLAAVGDKIGMVAGQFRFHPGLQAVKRLLETGRSDNGDYLGPVVSVRAEYGENIGAWRPGQAYRDSYSAHRDQGGGLFFDRIHEFDYLRWLFGTPSTIYATVAKRTDLQTDVEDVADVLMDCGGVPVSVHLDMVQRLYRMSLEVICEQDVIQWVYRPDLSESETLCLRSQAQHWLRVLHGREPPVQSLEDGYAVLRTALLAYKSNRLGVRVDPTFPVCGEDGLGSPLRDVPRFLTDRTVAPRFDGAYPGDNPLAQG